MILALGSLGGRVIGLLFLPLYTNFLTTSEFGTADLIVTATQLIGPVAFMAIAEAVLRLAMADPDETANIFTTAASFGAIVVAVATVCTASAYYASDSGLVLLFSAIIISDFLFVLAGALCRATNRLGAFAIAGVLQAGAVGLCNVLFLAVWDFGVAGFLTSIIAGNIAAGALLWITANAFRLVRTGAPDRTLLKRMIGFSAPLVPNLVLWWVVSISGRFILAGFAGSAAVGLFGVASRFPALLIVVTTIFGQAWQMSANRSADSEDTDRNSFYSQTFEAYSAILFLAASFLMFAIKPIYNIAVAPTFVESIEVVPTLFIAATFSSLAAFYGGIYTALHQTKRLFVTTCIAAAAVTLLNLALIPAFGELGAGLAAAIGFASLCLLRIWQIHRLHSVTPSLSRIAISTVAISIQAAAFIFKDLESIQSQIGMAAFATIALANRKRIAQTVGSSIWFVGSTWTK